MTLNYNVSGTERKALVNAMAEILECDAKYLGMPSAAYQVDYFTIGKSGEVTFDDRADSEEIENLMERLAERGFVPAEPAPITEGEEIGLTIALPAGNVNVDNLTRILEAKGSLIQKALGVDALPIEVAEDTVLFPWFAVKPDDADLPAITHLIQALCKMSVEQQRVNTTAKEVENEKYAFRCFLLRLGFIGQEYKAERKVLLRNFPGGSAFRNQTEAEKHKARQLAKRQAAKEMGGADHDLSE